jgi:hypothetical protein
MQQNGICIYQVNIIINANKELFPWGKWERGLMKKATSRYHNGFLYARHRKFPGQESWRLIIRYQQSPSQRGVEKGGRWRKLTFLILSMEQNRLIALFRGTVFIKDSIPMKESQVLLTLIRLLQLETLCGGISFS